MAYKKDVDDPRESPAFPILESLQQGGAVVSYSDPHVATLPKMRHHPGLRMDSTPLTREFLVSQDAVLIITDHAKFDYDFIVANSKLVIDTRNTTKGKRSRNGRIVKA